MTGFVADERNPFDGSWIARNKDAHAWVESAGRIVVGELPGGLDRYTPLPTLPSAWPQAPSTRAT